MNHSGLSQQVNTCAKSMDEALRRADNSPRVQPPTVPMEAEYNRLGQSIAELSESVSELLKRIAPVCQPGGLGSGEAKDVNGQKIEATPSDFRAKLMGLRANVDGISRQIADVKFRIEI